MPLLTALVPTPTSMNQPFSSKGPDTRLTTDSSSVYYLVESAGEMHAKHADVLTGSSQHSGRQKYSEPVWRPLIQTVTDDRKSH